MMSIIHVRFFKQSDIIVKVIQNPIIINSRIITAFIFLSYMNIPRAELIHLQFIIAPVNTSPMKRLPCYHPIQIYFPLRNSSFSVPNRLLNVLPGTIWADNSKQMQIAEHLSVTFILIFLNFKQCWKIDMGYEP